MTTSARKQLNQSNFLINNKCEQISFFDHNYKSYHPFSRVTKNIDFDTDFDFGKTIKKDLNKEDYGDLITNILIEVKVPDISSTKTTTNKSIGYTNALGHALFEFVELRFDGELIDKQTSEWMDIWSELSIRPGVKPNYDFLVKKKKTAYYKNYQKGTFYIPLHFWFCQNSSSNNKNNNMVLPLILLKENKIELIFKTRTFNNLIIDEDLGTSVPNGTFKIESAKLIIDYMILDNKQQKEYSDPNIDRFYLITQIQEIELGVSANTTKLKVDMNQFKYLVSEILWVVVNKTGVSKKLYFTYGNNVSSSSVDPISKTKITFEGVDRVEELSSEYFNKVEPFKIHDNTPFSYIHCYSFALSPEDFSQPSGICNFSEIHSSQLDLTFINNLQESDLKVYAINYNVLKVRNGKGTLMNKLSKSVNKNTKTK